ncbi:MAG: YceD family protein [Rhodoferax sp.]|nr:YceD family protein [Rhodoferax sp.]
MKNAFDPRQLNLAAFAKAHGALQGDERLAHFERLLEETRDPAAATRVQYAAQGEIRSDAAGHEQVWLRLSAQVTLSLVCQRCLEHASIAVACERDFRFVATEAQAALEDEVSEEDVLVISRSFDLLELVEDELLMALPVAPMHAECPTTLKLQVADPDFVETKPEKSNPFAVLQEIKNKRSS